MKKEVKIGILVIVGLAMLIWGYNFLKGQNLFNSQAVYYVKYENVQKLQKSSPVYINGFKVGNVKDIEIDPSNLQSIIVSLEILNDVKLPRDTRAKLFADGVMGDMAVELTYHSVCNQDCLQSGSFIEGETVGFLQSFIQPQELDQYFTKLGSGLGNLLDSLSNVMKSEEFRQSELGQITESFKKTMEHLEAGTAGLNRMIEANAAAMNSMINNLNTITGGLAENQNSLNSTIKNIETITETLSAEEGLKTTLNKTNSAIEKLGEAGDQTRNTLAGLDQTTVKLNQLLTRMNQGEGTLGKLMSDDAVYTELRSSLYHLNLLLQDFRLNPKRYVNVSVFGKKGREYTVPEEDPAIMIPDSTQN